MDLDKKVFKLKNNNQTGVDFTNWSCVVVENLDKDKKERIFNNIKFNKIKKITINLNKKEIIYNTNLNLNSNYNFIFKNKKLENKDWTALICNSTYFLTPDKDNGIKYKW